MARIVLIFCFLFFQLTSSAQKKKIVMYMSSVTENKLTSEEFANLKAKSPADILVIGKEETTDTLFIVYFSSSESKMDDQLQIALEGSSLPFFRLADVNGDIITSDKLKGKVVYINFWTTTCVPCRAEFPELNRLQLKYKDSNVLFLSMVPENDSTIRAYLQRHQVELPVLTNANDILNQWHVKSFPTHYFIDHDGFVKKIRIGTSVRKNEVTGKYEVSVFKLFSEIIDMLLTR